MELARSYKVHFILINVLENLLTLRLAYVARRYTSVNHLKANAIATRLRGWETWFLSCFLGDSLHCVVFDAV